MATSARVTAAPAPGHDRQSMTTRPAVSLLPGVGASTAVRCVVTIDTAPDAERQRILAELTSLGPALPGTLLNRYGRCGTPGCRCHTDPPTLHGPWWSWTRKVNGKTVTVRLTDEQARDY
jgi:uncharacterized protein DUF6788